MRKLPSIVAAVVAILLVSGSAWKADAATIIGSTALPTAAKNFSPIQKAACGGYGRYCGPGYVRTCGPYRCWCRPCY
jgi:hypothetical protein